MKGEASVFSWSSHKKSAGAGEGGTQRKSRTETEKGKKRRKGLVPGEGPAKAGLFEKGAGGRRGKREVKRRLKEKKLQKKKTARPKRSKFRGIGVLSFPKENKTGGGKRRGRKGIIKGETSLGQEGEAFFRLHLSAERGITRMAERHRKRKRIGLTLYLNEKTKLP